MKRHQIIIILMSIIMVSWANNVFCSNSLREPVQLLFKHYNELFDLDWKKIPKTQLTISPWIIYTDRDEVAIHSSPSLEAKVLYISKFLEAFFVIDKQDRWLKIKNDTIEGWSRVEQFILFPHAIRTKNAINYKAILVNRGDKLIDSDINTVLPLTKPEINAPDMGNKIRILDFAYIYKNEPDQNPNYVLIGKKPFFYSKDIKNCIIGWVPASRVLVWNTREAFQPNIKRKHPIYYFDNRKDLVCYYKEHPNDDATPVCDNISICRNNKKIRMNEPILVIQPDNENFINRKAFQPDQFRYPLLEKVQLQKPVLIGIPSATLNQSETNNAIEITREGALNRDIVFLIDGTMSMEKYVDLAKEIVLKIRRVFNTKIQKGSLIRFGLANYKDYFDGKDEVFTILHHLDTKIDENKWKIQSNENKEKRTDPYAYPEALFNGIIKTIEYLNSKEGFQKQIILIGDAGNASRGKDAYNAQKIARYLVNNDIALNAFQMTGWINDPDQMAAKKLFCQNIRDIIKNVADEWINILNNQIKFGALEKAELIKAHFQKLKNEAESGCCQTDYCCFCSNGRWGLRCIKTDQEYKKQISNEVIKFSNDFFDTENLLSCIQLGNFSLITSYPELTPGIIERIAKNIGMAKLKRQKKNQLNSVSKLTEKAKEIGYEQLKEYRQANVSFFQKASVMFRKPSSLNTDPDQFTKEILFSKDELEKLKYPFEQFRDKYLCKLQSKNIKKIWELFLSSTLNEIDFESSFALLYEQQFGISLRTKHPLLSISYSQIESGLNSLSDDEIFQLENILCDIANKLNKIYANESNYFKKFGIEYIWVNIANLP